MQDRSIGLKRARIMILDDMRDCAIVNIKLSKRGDINSQLDRYKEQQALLAEMKRRANAQETRENKSLAKILLAEHKDSMLERYSQQFGKFELLDLWDGWVKWEPYKMISFIEKFVSESFKA